MPNSFFYSLFERVFKKEEHYNGPEYIRIAVPYKDKSIFQHFGKATHFRVYDVEKGKVVLRTDINTNGRSHGTLPSILNRLKIHALICGGIGPGALKSLEEADVKVYAGVEGDTDEAVQLLIAGRLPYNPDKICEYHGQHQDNNNE